MPPDLLSSSKYLQPKSQIHKNDYLGLLTSSEIFHSDAISPFSNIILLSFYKKIGKFLKTLFNVLNNECKCLFLYCFFSRKITDLEKS